MTNAHNTSPVLKTLAIFAVGGFALTGCSESGDGFDVDEFGDNVSDNLDEVFGNGSDGSEPSESTEPGEPNENGATVDDYVRSEEFPTWSDLDGTGCDARNETLQRDLEQVVLDEDDCTVLEGVYDPDPFTGEYFEFDRTVYLDGYPGSQNDGLDIDHIVPVHYAVVHGDALNWDADVREQFANDPVNLVAADPSQNTSKSDSGPSDYLPNDGNGDYVCEYVDNFEQITETYGIDMPAADQETIDATC